MGSLGEIPSGLNYLFYPPALLLFMSAMVNSQKKGGDTQAFTDQASFHGNPDIVLAGLIRVFYTTFAPRR